MKGVYCITNLLDGRKYVGQSSNISTRWKSHLWNKALDIQRDIKKLGKENFKFEILEEVEDDKVRLEKEQYWIKTLNCEETGYNCSKKVPHPWSKGVSRSEEIKTKISETKKGKPHPHPKYLYTLPDGTVRSMTPQIAAREYLKKGITVTKLT